MLQCYNLGCGKKFDPNENQEESCIHHPGKPYFHDAYKIWRCCQKKSIDFTEFLNIKGCSRSKHNPTKPVEESVSKDIASAENPSKKDSAGDDGVQKATIERPPDDTPTQKMKCQISPKLVDEMTELMKEVNVAVNEDESLLLGSSCQNKGCKFEYDGPSSVDSECKYHVGAPIFHEGLKYWSCCKKNTTDFDEFLKQPGCTSGRHCFKKKKVVTKRLDWHQTPSTVVVSIFAKQYHPEKSIVELSPVRLKFNLVFPKEENSFFENDIVLNGIVDTEKSSVAMLPTKVEITLVKAEPKSWKSLQK